MKVLHLATSPFGGAGIAARRLNGALLSIGVDSTIHYGGRVEIDDESSKLIHRNFYQKLASSSITYWQSHFLQKQYSPITSVSLNLLQDPKKLIDPYDSVNIHSTYNLLNIDALRSIIASGKKIVITLHDQRMFTGGCHYSFSCTKFLSKCEKCPQVKNYGKNIIERTQKSAKEIFQNSKNVRIISPSRWLANLANESYVMKNMPIFHINNPIHEPRLIKEITTRFEPMVNLSEECMHRITFIAADLNNPNKGLHTLISAFMIMDVTIRKKFSLNLVGRGQVSDLPNGLKVNVFKDVSESQVLKILYESDLVVVPSGLDNSPNVIGESLMSGVAVIGSDTGGITELMTEFNLPTIQVGNSDELARKLIDFNWKYNRKTLADKARKVFGFKSIGKQYLAVYAS